MTLRGRGPADPAVLLVVAAVLVLFDHRVLAVVAVLVAVALAQASLLSPTFPARMARLEHAVGHRAGAVVSVVLLAPIHYLVVTPIGVVSRALGLDPLRAPSGRDGWQARSPSTPGRRRSYADERSIVTAQSAGGRRMHTVRVVVAVLVLQALLFGAFRLIDERRTPTPEFTGVSGSDPRESAALSDLPWVPDTLAELGEVAQSKVYTPGVGSSAPDFEGRYVNVANRERRSHVTTAPGDPVDVWFFGGSTMFGFNAQRDEHTIPSEVVRLAEGEGRPVRAHNYGGSGYTNYQETLILAQLLVSGERADLIVFYDGINDTALQLQNGLAHRERRRRAGQLQSDVIRRALVTSGVIPEGSTDPPAPLSPANAAVPAGDLSLDELIDDLVGAYGQGVDLAERLGHAYGIPVLHFWQPDLFSRSPLDPGEEPLIASEGMDDFVFESLRAYFARVRAQLPAPVIDISDAFDTVDGPVLADIVHVNEDGARAVAAAMYPDIVDAIG